MTDHDDVVVVIPPSDDGEERPDRSLAEQLVEQARADGVDLVGPGGLLSDLTQQVLEIFFQLTNIHSTSTVRLVIEHADGDLKVLGVEGRANAPSPLDVVSQKISLRNVPFQKPGKYWVQLLHEGEILIQAPLYLHLWQQGQQPRQQQQL